FGMPLCGSFTIAAVMHWLALVGGISMPPILIFVVISQLPSRIGELCAITAHDKARARSVAFLIYSLLRSKATRRLELRSSRRAWPPQEGWSRYPRTRSGSTA